MGVCPSSRHVRKKLFTITTSLSSRLWVSPKPPDFLASMFIRAPTLLAKRCMIWRVSPWMRSKIRTCLGFVPVSSRICGLLLRVLGISRGCRPTVGASVGTVSNLGLRPICSMRDSGDTRKSSVGRNILAIKKNPRFRGLRLLMAEREGFEPSIPLRVYRFSRAARSTTLPSLHECPRAYAKPLGSQGK
jgi:hypothetical protein